MEGKALAVAEGDTEAAAFWLCCEEVMGQAALQTCKGNWCLLVVLLWTPPPYHRQVKHIINREVSKFAEMHKTGGCWQHRDVFLICWSCWEQRSNGIVGPEAVRAVDKNGGKRSLWVPKPAKCHLLLLFFNCCWKKTTIKQTQKNRKYRFVKILICSKLSIKWCVIWVMHTQLEIHLLYAHRRCQKQTAEWTQILVRWVMKTPNHI
jgi:hypothetical protein